MVIHKRFFDLFVLLILLLVLVSCQNNQIDTAIPLEPEDPTNREAMPAPVVATPAVATERPAVVVAPTPFPTPAIILPAPLYLLSNGQIQRLETDGVTLTQLTLEAEPITDFDVSPIDARLIYVSGNQLIEANPQYGSRIVKVSGRRLDPTNAANYITERISDPRFSPD
jgi:hypothetical protein